MSTLNIVVEGNLLKTILTTVFTTPNKSLLVSEWFNDAANWGTTTLANTTPLLGRLTQIQINGVSLTLKNAITSGGTPAISFYRESLASYRVSTGTYSNKIFNFPNWTSPSGTYPPFPTNTLQFGIGNNSMSTISSSNIQSTSGKITFTFTINDNDILGFAGSRIFYDFTNTFETDDRGVDNYPIVGWLMKNIKFTAQQMHQTTYSLIRGASSGADIRLINYGENSSNQPIIVQVPGITGNTITIANLYNLIKNKTLYAIPNLGSSGTYA